MEEDRALGGMMTWTGGKLVREEGEEGKGKRREGAAPHFVARICG